MPVGKSGVEYCSRPEPISDPLFLEDRMEFHLESGACLQATDESDRYPSVESRMAGIEAVTDAPLLTGRDLEKVAITGNGHLDGAGSVWWEAVRDDRGSTRLRARGAGVLPPRQPPPGDGS